ncbi:MAG: hypothetical protein AUJ72_04250 [Candidatus Omnitrophica bacterium CG1_02_46_14]|nr:MAG: hypothetical protein AUJ72_04250 [Candidatus Omnitrophica bacterium CG1_02_46_14]
MMAGMKTFTVTENAPLLKTLLKAFPEYNRTKLKQILKYGSIAVNGKITTRHDHALKPGDKLKIQKKLNPTNERPNLLPPFPIVYEDAWILVIEKPEGLLTVSTETIKTRTVYYELTHYVTSIDLTGKERIFIVHRLDRDASGLLIFAKDEKTKVALQENWDHAEKKYYAVVEGTPKILRDKIESNLVEDKFRRVYSTGNTRLSKYAATEYEVMKTTGRYSLLDVKLLTGRKNQIRVHLADIGHPIVGDEKYGSTINPAGRLGLHAYQLSFEHPVTKEKLVFKSALPIKLQKLIF